MIEHFWQTIDGNSLDIPQLYAEMVQGASTKDRTHFVEVGAYKGRSTAYLVTEAINSGKWILVDVIDLWDQATFLTTVDPYPYNPATFAEFTANMLPVAWGYRPIICDSSKAASYYEDKSLDFVFIDGDHRYKGVLKDIEAFLPKVKPGGILAGHDWSEEYPGVQKATWEVFKEDMETRGIVWMHKVK